MSIEKTVKKTPQQQQSRGGPGGRPGGPGGRPGGLTILYFSVKISKRKIDALWYGMVYYKTRIEI